MRIDLDGVTELRFADGAPVRGASAVAALGDGYLVVQDDATHGAWFRGTAATAVRLLPPVDGLETFEEAAGTKHLKPDLEAACPVEVDGGAALLALGSGSSPGRMRGVLVRLDGVTPRTAAADLTPLYDAVATALGVDAGVLNLEGACVVGPVLRWFHRGLPSAGHPSGSVDLDLAATVEAILGRRPAGSVPVGGPRWYDLGEVAGVGLAVTDAVLLPDGALVLSAAAEDAPNVRDDGPVVGSVLVLLDADRVDVAPLPLVGGRVAKVEGLMALEPPTTGGADLRLRAVVDVDDPQAASLELRLRVRR